MNSKKTKLLVVLAVLAAGLIWWPWLFKREVPIATVLTAQRPKSVEATRDEVVTKRIPESQKERVTAELRSIVEQANQPIAFWGKVVDQDKAPVRGVSVSIKIRHALDIGPGGVRDEFESLNLVTDEAGLFVVMGQRGSLLGIDGLNKEGYEAPYVRNRFYWYSSASSTLVFEPNERNPEIFELWKKRGAERLIVGEKFFGLVPDGRVYAIDLIEGKKIEGGGIGDFTITIFRPPNVTTTLQYDWTATIEGIDGGFVETNDEFMNLAPEDGYVVRYDVKVGASDVGWSDRAKRRFFLKSNNARVYARLEMELFANYQGNAVASIKYFANAAGSRNLEYDPLQDIAAPKK